MNTTDWTKPVLKSPKLLPGYLPSQEQSLVFLEEMGQHKGLEITVNKENKMVTFVNKQVISSLSDIETRLL